MNPQSKYAVDTRRMMCTGKPRQGIKAWPMDRNIPGNELLGRYDLYPDPRGKEAKSDPKVDPPPTQAPQAPNEAEVQGVVLRRLSRKTNCAGADTTLDAWTQRNRDKIRDLQLRRALTGSVKRPRTRAVTENSRRNESVMISDDAALLGYLEEPPKLRRLTRKTKAPVGYIMYGPKDVHEAVQEYLQVERPTVGREREDIPQGPKTLHNQRSLDEAVMLVEQDHKGQGRISRVGENPETGAASSHAQLVPEVEYQWHSNARETPAPAMEEPASRQRSRPFRTATRKVTGSGMQYKPREDTPQGSMGPEPIEEQRREASGTKRRSQPFRKVKPRVGITFPSLGQQASRGHEPGHE